MLNILVVEDDKNLNQIICSFLSKNGYCSTGCLNPLEAYELLSARIYDLVITDIMMPKLNGYDFVEEVRSKKPMMPILFITALDDFGSKQKGFSVGADDYMVKPVDMNEMVLRVGALLRRAKIISENRLEIGELLLVRDEMAVYLNGRELSVSPREFNVLYKLLSHPKRIFTRSELMDEYWGMSNDTGLRTVDVYIARLRRELAECKNIEIITVQGFGYKAVLK